jgi:adenylate cyclase
LPEGERRLAAIMLTDIVEYTSLTEKDERLALELLEGHQKLLRPLFAKHNGKEIKTIGDGFLVEFGSVLEAVRCAIQIQEEVSRGNLGRNGESEVHLRIGIHVGDVEHKQGDLLGEAVNIASRIERFAEPDGIVVSRQVYDQIRNTSDVGTRSLGSKELKNVREPLEIFSISPLKEKGLPPSKVSRTRMAVLPFANISPDPSDEYFSDGMTEEMISTLSNISNLTVISRTSVMQYKGTKKNLADIRGDLKVGTMLEGSVRKAGNRVRITVQLIDAVEEKHLWAQSYDREVQDVFAVQSDIANSVAKVLKVKLLANEASLIQGKPTESDEAYLLYLRGRQYWSKGSEDDVRKAIEYFTLAIDHDPNFAMAYAGLADCYTVVSDPGYMMPAEAAERARPAVLRALQLDQRLAEAHAVYATVLLNDWSWDASEAEFKKAIELNPSYVTARLWYSLLLAAEARLEEALAEAKMALELDPLAPMTSHNVGFRLCDLGRYDEAIEYFNRSLAIDPNFHYALRGLGAAYNMKREFDKAMVYWEKWAQVSPSKTVATLNFALTQALAGNKDKALSTLDSAMKLQDSTKIPASRVAMVFATLHDEDRALDWLERALTEHDPGVAHIKAIPYYKELRSNPRFLEILKKMGLDKY